MSQTRFDRFYRISNQTIIDAYQDESDRVNKMLRAIQAIGDELDARAAVTTRMRITTAENFQLNDYRNRKDKGIWTKPDDWGYSRLKASRSSKWSDFEKATYTRVKKQMKQLAEDPPPVFNGEYLTMLGVCIDQIQLGGRTSVIGVDGALYLVIKFQIPAECMGGVEELLPAQMEQALKANEEDQA